MSEKEKEREEENEEEEILNHWSHEHPLILVDTPGGDDCYGCGRRFSIGEQAYGCSKECGYTKFLHEECAEMPRKITHSVHPQHILVQQHFQLNWDSCTICWAEIVNSIGYACENAIGCGFIMHMKCAQGSGTMDDAADDDEERRRARVHAIHHPSHPQHELRLFGRRSWFKCDACGTTRRGKPCVCNVCEYQIHQRCASLPGTMKREDHHHPLSLSYLVPPQYMKFDYKCEVCNKYLLLKYWIYHCHLCGYAVHLKCAFKTINVNNVAMDEKDVVRLPTNNVAEELIRPFVMRQGGGGAITPTITPHPPHDDGDDDETVKNEKKFNFVLHKHQLDLISSSSSHHHDQNNDDDDSDDEDLGKRSELLCDGCITPIYSPSSPSPPPSSSTSSSLSDDYYNYMSCSECKYNLHLSCFNLPPRIPSLPFLHKLHGHELVLINPCDENRPWDFLDIYCHVCEFCTDGLMYACRKCRFKADIKCASLPHTIHHEARPQRLLNLITPDDIQSNNIRVPTKCGAGCNRYLSVSFCYADSSYEFVVDARCMVLPASVRFRRWDRHHPWMPLTYDANLNHPGEFYCDKCETEMNPKSWMYHCRDCDLSFHPGCFETTSGYYRNFKFGLLFSIPEAHPHSLTYQLLTTKRRCDSCRRDRYEWSGFHCAPCNFFICLHHCGKQMDIDGRIHPID